MLAKRTWAKAQLWTLMNNVLDKYIDELGAAGRKEEVLTPAQLAFLNQVNGDRAGFLPRYADYLLEVNEDAVTDQESFFIEMIIESIWLYLAL
jgi:hypothetical protein